MTRFQNTHLEKAGFSLSVLDLTRAALAWVEEAFELATPLSPWSWPLNGLHRLGLSGDGAC